MRRNTRISIFAIFSEVVLWGDCEKFGHKYCIEIGAGWVKMPDVLFSLDFPTIRKSMYICENYLGKWRALIENSRDKNATLLQIFSQLNCCCECNSFSRALFRERVEFRRQTTAITAKQSCKYVLCLPIPHEESLTVDTSAVITFQGDQLRSSL